MKFSKKYIEICKELPRRKPKAWEIGDWAYLSHNESVMMLDDTSDKRLFRWRDNKDYINIDISFPVVWLPHSPVHWLNMKDWPDHWGLAKNERGGLKVIEDRSFFEILFDETEPLLACAKAWEKIVEKKSGKA